MGRILGKNIAVYRKAGDRDVLIGLSTSCAIDLNTDMVEMAALSSAFKAFKAGRSGGTISIERLYDTGDTSLLMYMQLNRMPLRYVVDVDGEIIEGESYISAQSANAPAQGYASHRVTLTCTGEISVGGYISFADSLMAQLCAERFGDGVGVTKGMAAAVTGVFPSFEYEAITSFDEFKYFTGVDTVHSYAFRDCPLTSIVVPDNIKAINTSAFYGTKLTSFNSAATVVSHYALAGSKQLVSVSIPNATTLGNYAMHNCPMLSEVTLGPIVAINESAFELCSSLKALAVPDSVTSIGNKAFKSSGLSSLELPAGVARIGSEAFSGCQSLQYVRLKSATPPVLTHENAFSGTSTSLIIYVPKGSLSAYQNATNWNTYANNMMEYAS